MSYALSYAWPRRRYSLGIATGPALTTTKTVAQVADVQLPDCSSAAVTGNAYIDSTFVKCCQDIKKMSGKSTKDKAKGIAECAARGAATGACMAAGVVTFGITTALAPLCGSIGAFVADSVMGWDTKQWIAAGIAGAACAVVSAGALAAICGFAAAELIGWLSDKLGPAIEGIFHPGAARDREIAKRRTDNKVYWDSVEKARTSEKHIVDQWRLSVNRVWDLFEATIPPASYADARRRLGFGNDYHSIALAMVNGGVPLGIMPQAELATHARDTYPACEVYGKKINGSYGPLDPICPPFTLQTFYARIAAAKSSHEESALAEKAAEDLAILAAFFFTKLPEVEAALATQIAVLASAYQHQQLLADAKAAGEAKLVASASKAAAKAQAAAKQATSWNSNVRTDALIAAQNQYNIAKQARALLLFAGSSAAAASPASVQKMAGYVTSAQTALTLATTNAHNAQLMMGATAAAGVAAIGFLLLRRT